MELQVKHTQGLPLRCPAHRRVAQINRIDHCYCPAADDFETVLRVDKDCSVLIYSYSQHKRVIGYRSQQASESVSLAKMLIDQQCIDQAQTRCQVNTITRGYRSGRATRNHMLGHDRCPGRSAGNVHAGGVQAPNFLRDLGATENGR